MKKLRLFRLKCSMFFRSSLLNLMLSNISPKNKLIIILSQDLDKYIVSYQKELLKQYCLEVVEDID